MRGGLLGLWRGQVLLEVTCPCPERVLNLCSARNYAFWDLCWQGPERFTCRLSRRDLLRLRRHAGSLSCQLRVLSRRGAPYAVRGLRRRTALAAGAVLGGLWLVLGSFFIWDIQISGNETVPRETILRALEEQGVGIGTFGLSLDGADLRNRVLLKLPQLSWIAVNVSGCRANVEVRERRAAPEPLDRRRPGNLVARRDALVEEVRTLGGVKAVLPGTTVTEGQLLISGVEDAGTYGPRLTAGLGQVRGETWYELTVNMPLTGQMRRYTGEEHRLRSVIFGTRRIKFYFNGSIPGAHCDKITERTQLRLLGIPLPVVLETETCRPYRTEAAALSPEAAEAAARAVLEEYLHTMVDPYGQVTDSRVFARRRGETLTVSLSARCREEIGTRQPVYTQEEPDGGSGEKRE